MDSSSNSDNSKGWEDKVELERMHHFENTGAEVLREWDCPEENEKAPGKGQLTSGHSFDAPIQSGEYLPVKNSVKPFTLFRADQLGEPVETADFVQDLLTEGGASVVYGPSNTGKSFWVLELAASVASGRPFMDKLETDQGSVI